MLHIMLRCNFFATFTYHGATVSATVRSCNRLPQRLKRALTLFVCLRCRNSWHLWSLPCHRKIFKLSSSTSRYHSISYSFVFLSNFYFVSCLQHNVDTRKWSQHGACVYAGFNLVSFVAVVLSPVASTHCSRHNDTGRHRPVSLCRPVSSDIVRQGIQRCRTMSCAVSTPLMCVADDECSRVRRT